MRPRLTMRCWVQRDQGGTDPFGGGESWADHLVDEPCAWWVATGREATDQQRSVVLADEHVVFARGTDIAAGDRIRRLVDTYGAVVFDTATAEGEAREVEHVAARRNHVDASLRSST